MLLDIFIRFSLSWPSGHADVVLDQPVRGISSKVLRPGETACMKMSQQRRRRWRPRHTVGMPRNTTGTKLGREVKAIIMRSTLSREGPEKKAADGSAHVAFTPFSIDSQGLDGL